MLLRSSISTTKKFLQRTIGNLKSFFSGGNYQKLPKSPAFDMSYLQSTSYRELDKLYTDFTDQWDSKIENIRRSSPSNKEKKVISAPAKQGLIDQVRSPIRFTNPNKDFRVMQQQQKPEEKVKTLSKEPREVGRGCLVAQKLKELEMLDASNVEHVLDIEEVLHFYYKLTCPAYLELVDKFFMDMYGEFFGPAVPAVAAAATPVRSVNSRQLIRPRSVLS